MDKRDSQNRSGGDSRSRPATTAAQEREQRWKAALEKQKREREKERQEQEEKRRNRLKWRKRGRLALVCLPVLLILLITSGAVYAVQRYVKVGTYSASGSERYSAAEIFAQSGFSLGEGLLTASIRDAQEKIPVALPYIASVQIKRKLPNSIRFQVTEITTVYSANSGDKWLLLSDTGKVLEETDAAKEGSLQVLLPAWEKAQNGQALQFHADAEENKAIADAYGRLLSAIEDSALAIGVTVLDMRDLTAVTLSYQDTVLLKLGGATDLANRLAWANDILIDKQKDAPLQRGTLDLTVEGNTPFRPEVMTQTKEETTQANTAQESVTQEGTTQADDFAGGAD